MNIELVPLLILLPVGIGLIILVIGCVQYFKTPKEIRNPKVEVSKKYKVISSLALLAVGILNFYMWYWEEGNKFVLIVGILFWLQGIYSVYDLVQSRKKAHNKKINSDHK